MLQSAGCSVADLCQFYKCASARKCMHDADSRAKSDPGPEFT